VAAAADLQRAASGKEAFEFGDQLGARLSLVCVTLPFQPSPLSARTSHTKLKSLLIAQFTRSLAAEKLIPMRTCRAAHLADLEFSCVKTQLGYTSASLGGVAQVALRRATVGPTFRFALVFVNRPLSQA
jgi:hypothetical protein